MLPYARIPSASAAAVNAAKTACAGMQAALVKDFEVKWAAWSKQWFPSDSTKYVIFPIMKPIRSFFPCRLVQSWGKTTWKSPDEKKRKLTQYPNSGPAESVYTAEFEVLVQLGAKIMPLVVKKLAESSYNFPGVFLYNRIEASKDFRVAPNDYINFKVLQRQANLIVDMNLERLAPAPAAAAASRGGK
jgi:hypothetical protein